MRNVAIVGLLALGLLAGGLTPAADGAAPASAAAAPASDSAKKKCRKGYRLRTVKKKVRRRGRRVTIRVKRCRKVKRRQAQPLFDPPGRQLEGEQARGFLQRYLADSRFTDCPAGWPSCSVEERYSHVGNGAFYYCRLTPSSGSDIRFSSGYTVTGAVVNADGSWAFDETVPSGGNPSYYSWRVSKSGVATGGYLGPDGSQQSLGPLQWVRGARDCSY